MHPKGIERVANTLLELADLVQGQIVGDSQVYIQNAKALAEAGADIILNGRNAAKLSVAAEALRKAGHKVHEAAFDVTSREAVIAAVDKIESQGPIDILFNNAGMQFRTFLEDYPHDKFQELFRVNVESVFLVGQAVAKHMIKRGRGKIINITSVQSELGRPSIAPYTATKGAVKMLTKGMCKSSGAW